MQNEAMELDQEMEAQDKAEDKKAAANLKAKEKRHKIKELEAEAVVLAKRIARITVTAESDEEMIDALATPKADLTIVEAKIKALTTRRYPFITESKGGYSFTLKKLYGDISVLVTGRYTSDDEWRMCTSDEAEEWLAACVSGDIEATRKTAYKAAGLLAAALAKLLKTEVS